MLKKLHFWLAALALIFSSSAFAQEDVTDDLLDNAGFDDESGWITSNVSASSTGTFQEVPEWTQLTTSSNGWSAVATLAIASESGQVNGATPPSTNAEGGTDGGVLGFAIGWGQSVQYGQEVTLEADVYYITYAVYNGNSSTSYQPSVNKVGFLADDGTTYYGSTKSFTYGEWVTETIAFELSEETSGNITVGYTSSSSGGSTSNAILFFDYVKIIKGLDLTAYNEAIAAAEAAIAEYPDYSGDELTALQALIDAEDPTTLSGSEEAIEALEEATEAFIEAAEAAEIVAWLPCTDAVGTSSSDWSGATGTYTYSTNGVSLTACERYGALISAGTTVFSQTISGLDAGTYEVQVYATAHCAWYSGNLDGITDINSAVSGVAQVYALSGEAKDSVDVPAYYNTGMDSSEPNTYTVTVVVEEGADLEIGLEVLQSSYVNWCTIQIASLKRGLTEAQAAAYYAEYVTEAEALVDNEYLASTIEATLQEYIDLSPARDEYTDAFDAIDAAISAAEANIEQNENLANGGSLDAGSAITGWATTNSQTLQYNTWSTETDNYGVENPFIENWVSSGSTLDPGSQTYYTAEGLLAGNYKVTGTVRILNEGASESIVDAEFFVGSATEDLTETGTEIYDFNSATTTALYGFIETGARLSEDGDLLFGLNIGENANYNWVAFKSFAITVVADSEIVDMSALEAAIEASQVVYDAAAIGDGLFLIPTEDGEAYAEAIAAAEAVYSNVLSTEEEVAAAVAALAEADSIFALAEAVIPSDSVAYTLVNKQTGYYLAVNDDATSTSGNIVMSSDDEELWYISYDSETGYSQLFNSDGDYICYVGTNTWTMGTTGTTFDIGIIPTEVDGTYYYQLEVYVNSRTRIIGTSSDYSDPATLYCDKVYSSIGDWGLWTIEEYVAPEDPLGLLALEAAIAASEKIYNAAAFGDGLFLYAEADGATYAEAIAAAQAVLDTDESELTAEIVAAAIAALQAADEVFAAAEVNLPVEGQLYTFQQKASGYYINVDTTVTSGNWILGEEVLGFYLIEDEGSYQLEAESGEYVWHYGSNTWTMGISSYGSSTSQIIDFTITPTTVDDDETVYYQLAVDFNGYIVATDAETVGSTLYDNKSYSSVGDRGLWIIGTVESLFPDSLNGYSVVGSEVVEVEVLEQTSYTGDTAEFDLEALLAALGTDDVDNCSQWIMNATDYSFVTNTTDSWRNADGDMETWGSSDGMVCVKIDDPSSGIIDYIGTIDATYEAGDEYDAYWAFTYGESAYIIDVHITFVAAEEISSEDYTIVGSTEVTIYAEPDESYTTTEAAIDEDAIAEALGCESIDDATFVAVVDGAIISSYTANYGYYFNSSGEVCSWGSDGCAFFVEWYGSGYSYLAFGQYPGGMEEGDSYTVTLYFIYGENAYSVTVTYTVDTELATGISSINSGNGTFDATSIYSLSGQLIRTQATTLEGLPQGIYIVGGKKVLVK